jgi:hypothetical protein
MLVMRLSIPSKLGEEENTPLGRQTQGLRDKSCQFSDRNKSEIFRFEGNRSRTAQSQLGGFGRLK